MYDLGFLPKGSLLKKLLWFKAVALSGAASIIKTVTGTAPITLTNAIAHSMVSLTQYGLCTQSGTPTPDAPVDILTNNGEIKYGALGRNLLDPSAANTVLGYYIRKEDGVEKDATSNFMFAGYMPVEPGKTYVAYGRAKTGNDLSDYNRVAWYDSTKTWIEGANYTQNRVSVVTAPVNAAYARFSCNPSGNTAVVVTQEIVDSYNWMFAEGTAEIVPFVPFVGGIYTDGEPEVLTVGGQNLVDLTAVTDGYYYDQNGVLTEAPVARLTDYIPVRAGQKYTLYVKAAQGGVSANVRCNLFNSVQEWMAQSAFTVNSGSEAVSTITPTENGYLRVSANATGTGAKVDWSTLQIVRGEYTLATMPPYEPYVTPQTVTNLPMLLSVGDYKDEAELIGGIKTGKVCVYVFTGEEAFTKGSAFYTTNTSFLPSKAGSITPICTHFEGISSSASRVADSLTMTVNGPSGSFTGCVYFYADRSLYATAADFKAWLASEYANGTPVIVLYPLATATTEQTTPHELHTSAGTNVVDVTAEVSGISLAAQYKATE